MGDEEKDEGVKGTGEMMKQADAGLKLFKATEEAELDPEAAQKFKDEADAEIKKLEDEAAALTGKDNKKARTEKSKQAAAVKVTKEYVDAVKVLKGLQPPNGNFVKKAAVKEEAAPAKEAAPAAAEEAKDDPKKKEKDEKKEKKKESAGISRAEKDELEKLKNQIIEKKKALKEQGMSGGQMNKDEEIVAWVARMNELKEKENPGGLQAAKDDKKKSKKKALDSETMKMLEEKQRAFDEYVEKLRTEFKYSKKDIAADPDYQEMKAEIDKLSK